MKNTVVVVTDLGLFKAYRLERTTQNTPRLELLEEYLNGDSHSRMQDKVTDQAGRYRSSTNSKWGTPWGERTHIELEQRRRYIKDMARHMSDVLRDGQTEACYFAAASEVNNQILDELEPPLRAKIIKNIPADLTKLDKTELMARFQV
jgi:hypothetical protein